MLLVLQPVSESRGEEERWRWDGDVWTDKAWVWHDELKTGHLTLADNNLTNSSLSPCVRSDCHLGIVSRALNAFCPFPSNELNDIIFVICNSVREKLQAKKQKRHSWLVSLASYGTEWRAFVPEIPEICCDYDSYIRFWLVAAGLKDLVSIAFSNLSWSDLISRKNNIINSDMTKKAAGFKPSPSSEVSRVHFIIQTGETWCRCSFPLASGVTFLLSASPVLQL